MFIFFTKSSSHRSVRIWSSFDTPPWFSKSKTREIHKVCTKKYSPTLSSDLTNCSHRSEFYANCGKHILLLIFKSIYFAIVKYTRLWLVHVRFEKVSFPSRGPWLKGCEPLSWSFSADSVLFGHKIMPYKYYDVTEKRENLPFYI